MTDKATWPDPPDHLSKRAADLYRELVGSDARSPQRIELLVSGLEARDRATEARELIASKELTTGSSDAKMQHAHPAVRIEKDSRAEFRRVWKLLGLDWDREKDGHGQGW